MTDPWLFAGAPDPLDPGLVTLLEGTTFCISDRAGNLAGNRADGLFVRDTRVLSRWHLLVAGHVPEPLTVSTPAPFSGLFVGLVPREPGRPGGDLLVVRRRHVGNGMREEVTLVNDAAVPVEVEVTLTVGTDFADLFEVKDGRVDGSAARPGVGVDDGLVVTADRSGGRLGLLASPEPPARVEDGRLCWTATVPARGSWTCDVEVRVDLLGHRPVLHHPRGVPVEHTEPVRRRTAWRGRVPALETPDEELIDVLRQSVEDLATLRIFDPDRVETPVIAAGAPWFMALFGRDSLLTAAMLLPLDQSLARGTLATLAAHQGGRSDPDSEEEPGRILHELRFGPTATLALGGRSAYYGSADATPLFVVLMGELLRWHGLDALPPGAVDHADRALAWMETFGDPDHDGFIEYERKTDRGLVNQGWKDSWDGINFADGRIAEAPIALAEVQGYAYAAYRARARIAEALGDQATAIRFDARAAGLKAAFNESFWLPGRGWYAVGLDRDKSPIDALTSNNGHLLWTGIADTDKAARVVEHLMSPEMFNGWGIRTLASSMAGYDPLSYHNGSVWPHDTALCVGGLARYGYVAEAGRVALGLLDAAAAFGHRLPELFGGFAREAATVPVPYPASCTPQAWASVAPVELLRALLGLEPDHDGLTCAPGVPARLLPLRLEGISCQGQDHTLEVRADGWTMERTPTGS